MDREEIINTIHQAAESWQLSDDLAAAAKAKNGWFTRENVERALNHWKKILTPEALADLADKYPLQEEQDARVGIVMAGNIPLVGLHDLICTLLAGYRVSYKPSSDDEVLIDYVVDSMIRINPAISRRIEKVDRLNHVDMVIATGSNNTARYFEHYFKDKPHLIRKNKTSVAVLTGSESGEELALLGEDVFSYFGKGCRNVSSVFIPNEETLQRLLQALEKFSDVTDHHKYGNNYTYHKAIWLMNGDPFYDTTSIVVKESASLHSPLGTLFITRYVSLDEVRAMIETHKNDIQAVVGSVTDLCDTGFGQSAFPPLHWFADNVDTLAFLSQYRQETT